MIAGDAARLEVYKGQVSERIYEGLEKVCAFDFAHAADGKYEIPGFGIMSVESPETEPTADRRLEGHLSYIDVVYLVEGEEWIGYLPKGSARGETEAYPERDLYFFEGAEEETKIHMLPGRFLVCFPEDLHRPLCAGKGGPMKIRKAVVKVPVHTD